MIPETRDGFEAFVDERLKNYKLQKEISDLNELMDMTDSGLSKLIKENIKFEEEVERLKGLLDKERNRD